MPSLNNILDKQAQIEGLSLFRMTNVLAYKALEKEENRICRLFLNVGQSRQHQGGRLNQYEGDRENNETNHSYGDINYNSQSQAEGILARYGAGGGQYNEISTRKDCDGRMYPFNPEDP